MENKEERGSALVDICLHLRKINHCPAKPLDLLVRMLLGNDKARRVPLESYRTRLPHQTILHAWRGLLYALAPERGVPGDHCWQHK